MWRDRGLHDRGRGWFPDWRLGMAEHEKTPPDTPSPPPSEETGVTAAVKSLGLFLVLPIVLLLLIKWLMGM